MVVCDKNEVLRYLGYNGQEISDTISEMIDKTSAEAEKAVTPRYCAVESPISRSADGIRVNSCGMLLCGSDIAKHLKGCESVILFAASIGADIERRIRIYEAQDLTRAIIMDCCGSSLIESYCDLVCGSIAERLTERGLFPTSRFSPGYGDLPLSLQPEFLRALNAQRQIGLTCNEQFLMFPRKSVTAVIGLSKTPVGGCSKTACDTCRMNSTCQFRKNKS